jgi:hypothetical protein
MSLRDTATGHHSSAFGRRSMESTPTSIKPNGFV